MERSAIEPNGTPVVRLTSIGSGNWTWSNSPKTFTNRTQSNVRKLNSLAIEHNRMFGGVSFKNCTQMKSHLFSNKESLLTNKLCAGFNFKHKYIGQISERAETAENVKPSVKLTILDENWFLYLFLLRSSNIKQLMTIEFGNRTNRKVPVPQLCSITEPIEQKFDR